MNIVNISSIIVLSLIFITIILLLLKQQKIKEEEQQQKIQNSNAFSLLQQSMENLRQSLSLQMDQTTRLANEQLNYLTQQLNDRLKDQGQNINQAYENMGKRLENAQEGMGKRLDNAARVVGELQNKLGKLEEANVRLFEVGKDIASLQEILRAPKLRGNLGELFLADLLKQLLPIENFQLQYQFKNREMVDAVVKLGGRLVSVDSKFPLENFKKFWEAKQELDKKNIRKQFVNDVKKHIDAIAQKYIRPEEGTFDFALMYVPAENVYYEMIIREDAFETETNLLNHAMKKRVIPVSPNNFYVYLHTVLLGLKGMQIEQSAREIQANLFTLRKGLESFSEDFSKVGTHINHARNAFESADKRLGRLQEKFERLEVKEELAINQGELHGA